MYRNCLNYLNCHQLQQISGYHTEFWNPALAPDWPKYWSKMICKKHPSFISSCQCSKTQCDSAWCPTKLRHWTPKYYHWYSLLLQGPGRTSSQEQSQDSVAFCFFSISKFCSILRSPFSYEGSIFDRNGWPRLCSLLLNLLPGSAFLENFRTFLFHELLKCFSWSFRAPPSWSSNLNYYRSQ